MTAMTAETETSRAMAAVAAKGQDDRPHFHRRLDLLPAAGTAPLDQLAQPLDRLFVHPFHS